MKRHPSLSFKKPEQLQKLRKDARKPDIIYNFYDKLEEAYIKNKITEFDCDFKRFLNRPNKIKSSRRKM